LAVVFARWKAHGDARARGDGVGPNDVAGTEGRHRGSMRLRCTVTRYPLVLAMQSHREAEEEEERLYGLARRHVKMHAKDAFLRIRVRLRAVMAVMMLALMTLKLASLSLGCAEREKISVLLWKTPGNFGSLQNVAIP